MRLLMDSRSGNVAPAHCLVLEGQFFGIVIKTGSSTLYCEIQHQREEEGHQTEVG